ncbi:MAG: hypothetical protein H0W50_12150 [Parachlamydiaceae bacterium]|nr:hypothetical protein [Parachlamydiaceae bacterium]
MLKRNIDKIAAFTSLRDKDGTILVRQLITLTEAKSYRIEVSELLIQAGRSLDASFVGSIEVEFFAASNLVFAFPATVINYYGEDFSSFVHTAQRVYNDFEDMQKNSQTDVPESGFNIHVDDNNEPFISLVNGPEAQEDSKIELQLFNSNGDVLEYTKSLGRLAPYQTTFLYPARELDLEVFLQHQVGACKAKFNLRWIFPRLLVGNRQKKPSAFVITHSYYDCSTAIADSNYWRPSEPDWNPASLMIPVKLEGSHFTNIYFYPIYSPSKLAVDIEIYSKEGKLLITTENVLLIVSPAQGHAVVQMREIAENAKLLPADAFAAKVIVRPVGESLLPARVKIALDIGDGRGLPCNICMNLQPFNPPLALKTHSFKWLPLLSDKPGATVWLMNSSPQKNFTQTATLELTFFREKDNAVLKRKSELAPNGFMVITPDDDTELNEFLEESIGWITIISSNAYLTTYYFSNNPSGIVGGDHGF